MFGPADISAVGPEPVISCLEVTPMSTSSALLLVLAAGLGDPLPPALETGEMLLDSPSLEYESFDLLDTYDAFVEEQADRFGAIAAVSNASGDWSVKLQWSAAQWHSGEVVYADPVETEEATAFQPTCVARAAVVTDTLIVAGWSQALGACVVERWTFVDGSVAQTVDPVTGDVMLTITPPAVRRAPVISSVEIGAPREVAFHPVSASIYVLEHETGLLHEFVNAGGEYSSATPELPRGVTLSSATHLAIGSHSNVPFALVASSGQMPESVDCSLIPDHDGDGVLEYGGARRYATYEAMQSDYPFDGWLPTAF